MADIESLPSIVPARKGSLHPWYKERLHIKRRKGTNSKHCVPGCLDARGWRFLEPGLDDFRSGYPPSVGDQNFIPTQSGFSQARARGRKRLTKEQVCFSKENPQQQARQRYVAEVEYTLAQHPLVLYPHFQECMSPGLLDQVVSVLDPEMSINREAASFPTDDRACTVDCAERIEKRMQDVTKSSGGINTRPPAETRADNSTMKNPYLRVKESGSKDDQGVNGGHAESPSIDEEIRRVTKRLHDWVGSLEGGNDDLMESTVFNLLAGAFQMQPSSQTHKISADKTSTFLKAPDSHRTTSGKAEVEYRGQSPDSNTGGRRTTGRAVRGFPTVTKQQELSTARRTLDEELEQSYTAQAFKKFILNKGLKEPEFLSSCERRRPRPLLLEY